MDEGVRMGDSGIHKTKLGGDDIDDDVD